MEHPRLLRPRCTQTQRKSVGTVLGPRHTNSKKESQFLKGDTNIREGVKIKRKRRKAQNKPNKRQDKERKKNKERIGLYRKL